MHCPKCGNENADNVWICGSCRHVLRDHSGQGASIRSRTSRLAVLSLVLGVLSLMLFVLTGIPAIIIGIISIVRIGRSGGMLRGKRIAIAGVVLSILLMGVFFLLWSLDAPPIPNDYTVADLRSAPAEYAESFEILKILIDEENGVSGAPAIGLTEDDLSMSGEIRGVLKEGTATEISEILAYNAKDIERAWANTKDARDVIGQLDAFAEISDLTEPSSGVEMMRVGSLVSLAHFYEVYLHLQTDPGDVQAFATELIELDSVLRKLSLNARGFSKSICHAGMAGDIVTANAIANSPDTSRETVELLAGHFTPLTAEQMSLRNYVLFEYLLKKGIINGGLGLSAMGSTPLPEENSVFRLCRIFCILVDDVLTDDFDGRVLGESALFKRNSTMRVYRNICDDWINRLGGVEAVTSVRFSVWPPIYPDMEPVIFQTRGAQPLLYGCYNPVGLRLVRMTGLHSFRGRLARQTALRIQDDLLQIVLKKRLGKEVSLKARAYGDEYIVDVENKKILSPGPDGEVGTNDDIALPINPEVLGW